MPVIHLGYHPLHELAHVSALNNHPQGDISTKEYIPSSEGMMMVIYR